MLPPPLLTRAQNQNDRGIALPGSRVTRRSPLPVVTDLGGFRDSNLVETGRVKWGDEESMGALCEALGVTVLLLELQHGVKVGVPGCVVLLFDSIFSGQSHQSQFESEPTETGNVMSMLFEQQLLNKIFLAPFTSQTCLFCCRGHASESMTRTINASTTSFSPTKPPTTRRCTTTGLGAFPATPCPM